MNVETWFLVVLINILLVVFSMHGLRSPFFTVVTVVYNSREYIGETIESVLKNSTDDTEYIIVDGGSTDGTVDIVREYGKRISRWISEPDDGIYDAMNKSLSMAQGQWVIFINAGDTLRWDLSAAKDTLINLRGTVMVVMGEADVKNEQGVSMWRKLAKLRGLRDFIFNSPACHQSIFYRRSKSLHYDTSYKVIADKYHLYQTFNSGGLGSFMTIPTVVSSYRMGGYSERVRKLYYMEEADFFSKVTKTGRIGRWCAYRTLLFLRMIIKMQLLLGWRKW